MTDHLADLDRRRGVGGTGCVHLQHAFVGRAIRTGVVRHVDVLAENRRLGDPRLDDRDAHAEAGDLERQLLTHPFERPLGGDIRGLRHRSETTGHRRDVDDRAAPACTHPRQHRLDTASRAAEVDVHDIEVALGARLLDGTVAADAGVVDQMIDAPRPIKNVLEALADRLAAGDVEFGQFDRETTCLGLGQKLPGPVDRPDRAVDRVAVFGEVEGRRPTDAAVGSGDDGNSGGGDFGVRHACNLGDISGSIHVMGEPRPPTT